MKNIVITGANRGIGLELTRQFAKDDFVYALCRSEFPADELHDHIEVVTMDVTDESAIKEFAAKLDSENVAVDLLINNAGISRSKKAGERELDTKTATEVFAVNVVAPMILSAYLSPALKRSEVPAMIAISSQMGTHALLDEYNAKRWAYSSSKAALCLAVASFAMNEPEIQSISVHPGWVKTRMGGDDADIDVQESANGIKKLYETIDKLESGRLYNYDGALMDW